MSQPLRALVFGEHDAHLNVLLKKLPTSIHPIACKHGMELDWHRFPILPDLVVLLPGQNPDDHYAIPYDHPILQLKDSDFELSSSQLEALFYSQQQRSPITTPLKALIGISPAMAEVRKKISKVAQSHLAVHFFGENGTGKDLAANITHQLSTQRQRRFVPLNCGAIPVAIAESELFGSAKGAYTDAPHRDGVCQQAAGGTLFLDEIGELPLDIQVKLLRVLDNHEIRRIGSTQVEHVQFRLMSATNRDLRAAVKLGEFREDLYYRINGVSIRIPPLRERLEDLPLLVRYFYSLWEQENHTKVQVNPQVLGKLVQYHWPGNLRQLRNVLIQAAVLNEGQILQPEHFDLSDF